MGERIQIVIKDLALALSLLMEDLRPFVFLPAALDGKLYTDVQWNNRNNNEYEQIEMIKGNNLFE